LFFIFIAGRIHFVVVIVCECESEAETLVRLGYWPSSAEKPKIGYSLELLELFHFINLECQSKPLLIHFAGKMH